MIRLNLLLLLDFTYRVAGEICENLSLFSFRDTKVECGFPNECCHSGTDCCFDGIWIAAAVFSCIVVAWVVCIVFCICKNPCQSANGDSTTDYDYSDMFPSNNDYAISINDCGTSSNDCCTSSNDCGTSSNDCGNDCGTSSCD